MGKAVAKCPPCSPAEVLFHRCETIDEEIPLFWSYGNARENDN